MKKLLILLLLSMGHLTYSQYQINPWNSQKGRSETTTPTGNISCGNDTFLGNTVILLGQLVGNGSTFQFILAKENLGEFSTSGTFYLRSGSVCGTTINSVTINAGTQANYINYSLSNITSQTSFYGVYIPTGTTARYYTKAITITPPLVCDLTLPSANKGSSKDITTNSFRAEWPTVTEAVQYQINIAKSNEPRYPDGENSTLFSTTNSIQITNLDPNTSYKFQIRAKCANGTWTDWSNTLATVTTLNNPPTISINTPPSNNWGFGETKSISWNVTNIGCAPYTLELSTNDGASWVHLVEGTNNTSFNWSVGKDKNGNPIANILNNNNLKLKVYCQKNTPVNSVSGNFKLKQPSINVTLPTNIIEGNDSQISWSISNAYCTTYNADLILTDNSAVPLKSQIMNSTYFTWSIPFDKNGNKIVQAIGKSNKIKVYCTGYPEIYGLSSSFTLQAGSCNLTLPSANKGSSKDITTNSFRAVWPTVTEAVQYQVNIAKSNEPRYPDGENSTLFSSTNSLQITNLDPNTSYKFQIRAKCANGTWTDWSSTLANVSTIGEGLVLIPNTPLPSSGIQNSTHFTFKVQVLNAPAGTPAQVDIEFEAPDRRPYVKTGLQRSGNIYSHSQTLMQVGTYKYRYIASIPGSSPVKSVWQSIQVSAEEDLGLISSMIFGGGLTVLEVDKSYTFTTAVKNNKTTNWTGKVYLKVNDNITMELLPANTTINSKKSKNISKTFSLNSGQIGKSIKFELWHQESGKSAKMTAPDYGIANPVYISVEKENTNEVIKQPFINLKRVKVNPGETVQFSAGNYPGNTNIILNTSPEINGYKNISLKTSGDGSILSTIVIPSNFKEKELNIYLTYNNNVISETVNVIQPNSEAELIITSPNQENQELTFGPNSGKQISISIKDKLVKNDIFYTNIGINRSYQYEIGFYDPNGNYQKLYEMPTSELGQLNSELNKTFTFNTSHSRFNTSGKFSVNFVVKDKLNPNRTATSVKVLVEIMGGNMSLVSKKWDRSFNVIPNIDPIGIAADGTARIYLKVERKTSGSQIKNINVSLSDPSRSGAIYKNASWLGRVKYATKQNNDSYELDANGINTITAQNNLSNNNGQYWFWYVAPDDFTWEGAGLDNSSERVVTATFNITYQDGTSEQINEPITIVRPPLMLVHGLNGSGSSWDGMPLLMNPETSKLFKIIHKPDMDPNASFSVNAYHLRGGLDRPASSIFNAVARMRALGFASSQVDYIAHSMGGAIFRQYLDTFKNDYYSTSSSSINKNYQKGWVNKFITIGTPHGGSPWADLINALAPLLPIRIKSILSGAFLINGSSGIFDYIKPTDASLNAKLPYYEFEATNAVKNLQVIAGNEGIDFKVLSGIPTHLITGDVIKGDQSIPDLEESVLDVEVYNSYFQHLYTILDSFTDYLELSEDNTWLNDFARLAFDTYPDIFQPADAANKVKSIAKSAEILSLFTLRYNNIFTEGDIVVPLLSQMAGYNNRNLPFISVLNEANIDFTKFHTKLKTDLSVSNRIIFLLNKSKQSQYFTTELPSFTRSANSFTNNDNKARMKQSTQDILKPYVEIFDKNIVEITSPSISSKFSPGSTINIKVKAKDKKNLTKMEVIFEDNKMADKTVKTNYNFSANVKGYSGDQLRIMAVGTYVRNDSVILVYDTLSVKNIINEELLSFNVEPKITSLDIDEELLPSYQLSYHTFTTNFINNKKLQVEIENPEVISFNPESGEFLGLMKGETQVYFLYDKTYRDTMYVSVAGGGTAYSQTIKTGKVTNKTICAGGTGEVAFTTSGGSFSSGNQFLVQLSDINGKNFKTITTSGNKSPLSFILPDDIEAGSGYRVRVVSTEVPVIGSTSTSIIKVTNLSKSPIISSDKLTFIIGETITLTAKGCSSGQSILWSTGHTSSTINIMPSESANYFAVCTQGECQSMPSNYIFIQKVDCKLPDLSITDIEVTKYTSDRIYYKVKMKNIGEGTADLGMFNFTTYGSSKNTLDTKATERHTMFMGGGSLAKNKTINYETFISMNYGSNQHYLIVEADAYNFITECNKSNNVFSKVVKSCIAPGNVTLTGAQPTGFIGSNGIVTISSNAKFSTNTLVAGKAINGMPGLTASGNNINFIVGTCINVASSGQAFAPPPMPQARLKQENTVTFSDKELEFSANNNQKINRVSIWDMGSKAKVAEYGSILNAGIHKISTENLISGKQYLIQIETEEGFYNKVYEYLE